MVHPRRALALVSLALLGACMREPDARVVEAQAPQGPAPALSSEVELELRGASRVDVGDALGLELHVRNRSEQAITLVRPVYGAWELARHPRYELVWADEQGQPIADPLGFAPGLECGTMDLITRADLVTVEPGGRAALRDGPSARSNHAVLPSARPGRYSLRVRYLAQGIDGASALQVLSQPIAIEIVGGDVAAWSCRAEQLEAEAKHEWVNVSPAGLLARDDGLWLLASSYRHRVVEHETRPGGEVWLQRLASDLSPSGDPQPIHRADEELGYVRVAELGTGLLVLATPGPVGGRRIAAWPVELVDGRAKPGPEALVQAAPGNPYVTRTLVLGDRVALLHAGADADAGALMLSFVDRSGTPLGPPRRVAAMATDFELLAGAADEVVAVWLERGDVDGGVLQRFDGAGQALAAAVRFAFDPSHSLLGARLERDTLELAWADAGTRGDDPRDMMGLYRRSFSSVDGSARGPARALVPESRSEARFGALAWSGKGVAQAVLAGATLSFATDTRAPTSLSSTAGGTVELVSTADGAIVLWTDRRDDGSRACAALDRCVSEVYGAHFGADGSPRGPARRLTTQARAHPFVPSSFDWQQHCRAGSSP